MNIYLQQTFRTFNVHGRVATAHNNIYMYMQNFDKQKDKGNIPKLKPKKLTHTRQFF